MVAKTVRGNGRLWRHMPWVKGGDESGSGGGIEKLKMRGDHVVKV